jgi:hypothetical protein
LLTNALPVFLTTLAMAGMAPSNTDGTFIGVNNVTDNSSRYDLGNTFVQNSVQAVGYSYFDTQIFGTTNDLVRRQWVLTNDCIHLNGMGVSYLADLIWHDGGFSRKQNLLVGTALGNRVPFRVYAGFQQVSNLMEITDYGGSNIVAVSKDGFLSVGPRLTGTYMLDLFGNLLLGRTNFSTSLGFTRLNSSSSLAHQILFDALNANTATITYERDSGRLTINSGGGAHIIIDADNNQTSNFFSIERDAANQTNAISLLRVQEDGKAGLGTNSPQAFFHVAADNVVNDIMRLGTTNRPNLWNVNTNGVMYWPTNTVTTPPVLALGSFAYWNSNGLMLWKCWNTNNTTVCVPTP